MCVFFNLIACLASHRLRFNSIWITGILMIKEADLPVCHSTVWIFQEYRLFYDLIQALSLLRSPDGHKFSG